MEKKDFDWNQFVKLCGFPKVITQEDIAEVMGVSVDTCERRIKERYPELTFAEFRKKCGGRFRHALLNKQMETAMRGSVTMLIHLGQHYLGQNPHNLESIDSEKQETLIIDLSGESFKTPNGGTSADES
jgi:hypothetical protein